MCWKTEYNQLVNRATREIWEALTSPSGRTIKRWQLWYAPGNLLFMPDGQPIDGMEPVQGSTEIPWRTLTIDQIRNRVDAFARQLPILTDKE